MAASAEPPSPPAAGICTGVSAARRQLPRRPATVDGNVVVGRRRPIDNPLIGAYEVGVSRGACRSPHFDDPEWIYGMPSRKDGEGAGDVVLSWKGHVCPPRLRTATGKDFLSMNKRAAAERCVTPAAVSSFRKENELRIPQKRCCLNRARPPSDDSDRIYGHTNKAGVSVGELITNKFESEWIEKQLAREAHEAILRRRRDRKSKRRQFIHPPPPSVKEQPAQSEPRQYVLRQLRQVPSRTQSGPVPHSQQRKRQQEQEQQQQQQQPQPQLAAPPPAPSAAGRLPPVRAPSRAPSVAPAAEAGA
eukprot:TRINITY_DN13702_c1_g2_i1.p1 TRINITY_DN13702_c1_g2~~TRINITY_DN13702_c1_g2_i1.p1  ORF type:complete len:338 (+),score=113.63 TRINITY_DN13702_c1_g2_i1:103-1014(+)